MQLKEVMTRGVEVIAADASLSEAAARMQALDVGLLPVGVGDELVGMLTDRDITVRATAAGDDPLTTRVRDMMTTEIIACYEDEDLTAGAQVMAKRQVRRLLILDRDEQLVGVVSLGDVATITGDARLTGGVLEGVSEPSGPPP